VASEANCLSRGEKRAFWVRDDNLTVAGEKTGIAPDMNEASWDKTSEMSFRSELSPYQIDPLPKVNRAGKFIR
jgi:hypothetical protein